MLIFHLTNFFDQDYSSKLSEGVAVYGPLAFSPSPNAKTNIFVLDALQHWCWTSFMFFDCTRNMKGINLSCIFVLHVFMICYPYKKRAFDISSVFIQFFLFYALQTKKLYFIQPLNSAELIYNNRLSLILYFSHCLYIFLYLSFYSSQHYLLFLIASIFFSRLLL